MSNYGYMRVSSVDQNEDRQRFALEARAIPRGNIFLDKLSGKNFDRPEYQGLLERLTAGDQLFITSIDRLGRNYTDIQDQWRLLTRDKQVDICVLDMPLLDTRRDKNLLGTFVADMVLQVLSFVAQQERENIHKRQSEGIAAAQLRGVRFGRQKYVLPETFGIVYELWKDGTLSGKQAAESCKMARTTFRYYANKKREEVCPKK